MRQMKRMLTVGALAVAALASGAAENYVFGPFELGFRLRLARPGSKTLVVSPATMKELAISMAAEKTTVTWRGHPVCGEDFTVTAEIAPADDGWNWRFRYAGNVAEGVDVDQVLFPVLEVPRTEKTAVLVPHSLGMIHRPDWHAAKPESIVAAKSPHSFRFIASFDEQGGRPSYYLDERGARGHAGRFLARQGARPNTVQLVAQHDLPVSPALNRARELPYGGTFRTYRGGWFEAAAIYREWVKGEPWVRAARARQQPAKLRDIALWMWNRGLAEHVIAPAEKFADETGLRPALDWYWWHKIPYDTGYPNFWPPREGEAAFRAAVARMKRRGIFSQVYTNGMTWDCDDPTFEPGGGLQSVRYEKRGDVFTRVMFNVYTKHSLAYMCGQGRRFQDFFANMIKPLAGCGLDGLYMDQISCGTLGCCWSEAHDHPPGGGNHQTEGFRDFFRRIHAENPGLLISSEEPSEEYLECVDSFIQLWQTPARFTNVGVPTMEAVPVYQALHHGEVAIFGTYAVMGGRPPWDSAWPDTDRWQDETKWEKVYPADQFAYEVATGVVFGNQPTVHNLTCEQIDDPKLSADWKFLKDTARFYYDNRDLLYDGLMEAPGRLACELKPMEMAMRGIYTTEKTFKLTHAEPAAVMHSVWRAPGGEIAAVFVNWTGEPRSCSLDCPSGRVELTLPPRSWKRVGLKQK